MSPLDKMNLIDLYYPTDETVAALFAIPPEQRETMLRRMLSAVSEAVKDAHISRILAMLDAFARRDRP
jgi:truncated hemoglobin YjbI